MAEAILLDYGHTIVNFITNERTLLAAYDEVAILLAHHVAGDVPAAAHLVEHVSQRIARRIEDSYLRQELAELDILQEFQEAFVGIDLQIPATLVRAVAVIEHRALAVETFLPHDHPTALRRLRAAGYRLGLVSNISLLGDLVREDLENLGLLDLFDSVVLSSELGLRKPHPRVYEHALAEIGVPAARAIFVGDRLREDIGGPQQAGMRAVLTHQFRQEQPGTGTPQPDGVIQRLPEILAAVRHMEEAKG